MTASRHVLLTLLFLNACSISHGSSVDDPGLPDEGTIDDPTTLAPGDRCDFTDAQRTYWDYWEGLCGHEEWRCVDGAVVYDDQRFPCSLPTTCGAPPVLPMCGGETGDAPAIAPARMLPEGPATLIAVTRTPDGVMLELETVEGARHIELRILSEALLSLAPGTPITIARDMLGVQLLADHGALLAQITQLAPHEHETLPAALHLNDTELALVPTCYRERVLGYDCPNRFVEVRAIDAGGVTILPGEMGEIETETGRYAVRLVRAEQDVLEGGDCSACAAGRLVALEAELALLEAR